MSETALRETRDPLVEHLRTTATYAKTIGAAVLALDGSYHRYRLDQQAVVPRDTFYRLLGATPPPLEVIRPDWEVYCALKGIDLPNQA
jgi:hypothetical protein